MNKSVRLGAGAVVVAAASLLAAAPAYAATAPGTFTCDPGSIQIDVPNPIAAQVNQPPLAGTVCVFAGTTSFRYERTYGGWRAEVSSPFGSKSTNVRFYEPSFKNVKPIQVISQGNTVVIKK